MSENSAAKPKGGLLKWALWGVALIGVAAVLYIIVQASAKPDASGGLGKLAKGEMRKLAVPAEPHPAPSDALVNAKGAPVRLADFKGKVLVMNVWATWCGPCREEMPTLAKLQAEYAGAPVAVVPVSIDSPGEVEKAKAFIAEHAPLAYYADPKMKLPFSLKPQVADMPTTVIYGKDGLERARLTGGADWSGGEAKAVIDKLLAEG